MALIYALGDPRTGQIHYIGVAKDVYRRYAQHLNYPHRNDAKDQWMADLKQNYLLPTLTILEPDVELDVLLAKEQYWIARYLAEGAPLTNNKIYTPIFPTERKPLKKSPKIPTDKKKLPETKSVEPVIVQPVVNASESKKTDRPEDDIPDILSDGLFSLADVAAWFRVPEKTIFNHVKAGDLKGLKEGDTWYFEAPDIEDFIARQRQKTEEEFDKS